MRNGLWKKGAVPDLSAQPHRLSANYYHKISVGSVADTRGPETEKWAPNWVLHK